MKTKKAWPKRDAVGKNKRERKGGEKTLGSDVSKRKKGGPKGETRGNMRKKKGKLGSDQGREA